MLVGFRAGDDAAIKVRAGDFAGTRRAWRLPEAAGTMLARVFPDQPFVGPGEKPARLVARLDRACRPALDAGMVPFWSFKPDVRATIVGDMDPLLTAVGQWVARTGVRMYGTVWHEPENDAMAAGQRNDHGNHTGRARNFVNCYTRARDVMKTAAGDLLQLGPVHMVYHWRPGSRTTAGAAAAAWRVRAAAKDFTGADTYTSNWSLKTGAGLRTKVDFQRWRTALPAANETILVVERGITRNPPKVADGGALQAATLADDFRYLAEIGAIGLMYWNSSGATDDSNFLLGPAARQVFAAAAARLA